MSDDPAYILKPGEAYPEEIEELGIDEELHEFNRLTKKVAEASSFYLRWWRYVAASSVTDGELRAFSAAKRGWEAAVDQYEEFRQDNCQDTDESRPDIDKT